MSNPWNHQPAPGSVAMPEPPNAYASGGLDATAPSTHNAYQTGAQPAGNTLYGQNTYSSRKSGAPEIVPPPPTQQPFTNPKATTGRDRPSAKRLILRFIMLLCSVASLGFLAGAKPYSGKTNPFDTSVLINLLYVISAISILVSLFFIGHYLMRRVSSKREKVSRWIPFTLDTFLALAFGIISLVMIIHYKCDTGALNGWCDFYNTAIAFAFMAFIAYGISVFWDIGGVVANRRKGRR